MTTLRAALFAGAIVCSVRPLSAAEPSAAKPEYKPVPAEQFHARDGLGNVFAKLQAGQAVRIAYFGGSITAANGWRVKSLEWFRNSFPKANVSEIHAAIGGTGSDLGVFRLKHDVLDHKPDLVFVEFAVNDSGGAPERIFKSMEGIVRQIWRADPAIDICFVYTFVVKFEKDLDNGMCPRGMSCHDLVAAHYGIPSINVALRIAQMAKAGKLVFQGPGKTAPDGKILFSNDGVHPIDAGHDIYRDVIAECLAQAVAAPAKAAPHVLKARLGADNWENAKLLPLTPDMLSAGWVKLDAQDGIGKRFLDRMPEIWRADKPGETLSFRFKGTTAMLYDLLGPDGGQVMVTVDGKEYGPRPRFDSYCTYHRLATLSIAEGLPDAVHTVTVRLHPDMPNRSSVTDIEKKKPGFDPKRYEGTVLRVGGLLLLGDLVK